MKVRNKEIYKKRKSGMGVYHLSDKYNLTPVTIKRIISAELCTINRVHREEKIKAAKLVSLQEEKEEMKAVYEDLKNDPEMAGYIK